MTQILHWFQLIRRPEWIQAFAAIVALFIAIYVPLRIRRLDRRAAEDERHQKADALALFISADVFEISVEAIKASTFLEYHSGSTRIHSKREIIEEIMIKAAERLQPTADRLWLLESNCAKAANRAISDSLYFNRGVKDRFLSGSLTDEVSPQTLKEFYSLYKSWLENARKNAEKAIALFERHYDFALTRTPNNGPASRSHQNQ